MVKDDFFGGWMGGGGLEKIILIRYTPLSAKLIKSFSANVYFQNYSAGCAKVLQISCKPCTSRHFRTSGRIFLWGRSCNTSQEHIRISPCIITNYNYYIKDLTMATL